MISFATKVWPVVIFIGMTAMGGKGDEYNREEFRLLCNVLAAAAKRWGTNGEKIKDQNAKEALHQTIFGTNGNGGKDPMALNLQSEYHDHHDHSHNNRLHLCGTCGNKHYPGESAPHDLLCLCTPGPEGIAEHTSDTLCGRKANDLGSKQMGQPYMGFGPNAESVKKTWAEIVQSCLRKEVDKGLKRLLEEFNKKVEGNRNKLGGAREVDHTLCGGNALNNTCVNYAGDGPGAELLCHGKHMWWRRLYEAVKDEPLEKEIENKQNSEKPEKVETNKPSEKITEAPKAKNLTAMPQTTSQKNSTLIIPLTWPLFVLLLN